MEMHGFHALCESGALMQWGAMRQGIRRGWKQLTIWHIHNLLTQNGNSSCSIGIYLERALLTMKPQNRFRRYSELPAVLVRRRAALRHRQRAGPETSVLRATPCVAQEDQGLHGCHWAVFAAALLGLVMFVTTQGDGITLPWGLCLERSFCPSVEINGAYLPVSSGVCRV